MFSLNDLCFLCLNNNNHLKNITTADYDGVVVEEKLRYFLFELVNIQPEIPKNICYNCLKDLNQVYDFKQRCLRNIIKLNNYILHLRLNPVLNIQKPSTNQSDFIHTSENSNNSENNEIVTRESVEKVETDKNETECVLLPDNAQKTNLNIEKNDVSSGETSPENSIEDIVVKIEPVGLPEDDEDDNDDEDDDESMEYDDSTLQSTSTPGKYDCPKCDRYFPNQLNLRRHLRSHVEEKPYKCDFCSYETVRPLDLKYHVSKHTGDKPLKCDTCDYRCARPKDMRSHMRSHTGERPYECEICHKRFPHISNLKRHGQTHSTEKPHHCTYCDFKCSHADYLKVHVRQHTGDKQYQCDVCTKRFATNSHLLRHRRFHDDNLRPHKCSGCDKSFKLGSHLSKHIERAHTNAHPCQNCGGVFNRSTELYRHKQQCLVGSNAVFIKQEPVGIEG